MIRRTPSGLVVTCSPGELDALRGQFQKRHYVRISSFLAPDLLQFIQQRIDEGTFQTRIHDKIGVELCLSEESVAHGLLTILVNDRTFFQFLSEVTGCGAIGSFSGRVYRMLPTTGHYDSWHTDLSKHRMLAMSVNLGSEPYQGGTLQLQNSRTREILEEVINTGPGDAVIFRIAEGLAHRVTNLEGTVSKTAFAGWFLSEPPFLSTLKRGG